MSSITKYFFILTFCFVGLNACSKDETSAELNVTKNMIADKTWYLDFTIINNVTKSYVGQTTYFINFLKSGQTKDSDGITGFYTIQKPNNILQVYVNANTISGAPVNYTYEIESVGNQNLILSYTKNGVKTQLYYSIK
jgi:hypothetical protein